MHLVKSLTRVGIIAVAATMMTTATPAFAASRDGVCDTGEFCYYFNSGEAGSISDFTGSISDYGTTQPSCYDFKGTGNGKGTCVKNNAASVWNRSSKTVRVYFNSGYAGAYQDFASGAKGNLSATLKNQNASHQFLGSAPPATGCSTAGTGDPRSCAQAVSWANSHIGSTSLGTGTCDHVVGLAYGWSSSGSHDAYAHWTQVPASKKHAGARTVPAGGLAFFKGGSGLRSRDDLLGGGSFASTDVGTDGRYHAGRYGKTTIATIESSFHETYLGWTQPWFNR